MKLCVCSDPETCKTEPVEGVLCRRYMPFSMQVQMEEEKFDLLLRLQTYCRSLEAEVARLEQLSGAKKGVEKLFDNSFVSLWLSYCDVKMERSDLQDEVKLLKKAIWFAPVDKFGVLLWANLFPCVTAIREGDSPIDEPTNNDHEDDGA